MGYFRSAFAAWLAIVALVVQLGSPVQPRLMADAGQSDGLAALGALTALLGPNVVLCVHEGGSEPGSPPRDSHHCCDDCALCQLTGHVAALMPPGDFVLAQLARDSRPLRFVMATNFAKPPPVAFAQPRAPPISA
jgi:hypothetical protein